MTDLPPWAERTMKRVQSRPKNAGRDGKWGTLVSFKASADIRRLLSECAQARGMNRASYIRRALIKQLVIDTDYTREELLAMTPMPIPYGASARPYVVPGEKGIKEWTFPPDSGEGHGEWWK